MANFVRRIVSGNKARFKDAHLDVELDLVYVTDQIIIMGFPAAGMEGFYRNRREDAKKFLDHRHANNYWVFNFCPLRENSYPATFFEGRVSRYPFPDHHAPPLAILPLAAREIREWLSGSPDRIAVLHCKAGKGRSGTLACAYLLSLDESPTPPKLERSMAKECATARADKIMDTVETEEMNEDAAVLEQERVADEKRDPVPVPDDSDSGSPLESPQTVTPGAGTELRASTSSTTVLPDPRSSQSSPRGTALDPLIHKSGTETLTPTSTKEKSTTKLEDVLALHTSRRMKTPSKADEKLKQGVSIPSQRRWLHYWSLVLAHASPPGFWDVVTTPTASVQSFTAASIGAHPRARQKVRLRQITVRMHELTGMKKNVLKLANTVLERTASVKNRKKKDLGVGNGLVWVSLARYDDKFVDLLESWEKHTRAGANGAESDFHQVNMGKRRAGSGHMDGEELLDLFKDGKWDKAKMIRSFSRLGDISTTRKPKEKEGSIVTYTLKPLTEKKWEAMQDELASNSASPAPSGGLGADAERNQQTAVSTASSVTDLGQLISEDGVEDGVVLDANRELRAKLYIGKVFIGWFWFIPTFHMPHPIPSTSSQKPEPTHFKLTRKEVDFPVGIGSHIVDVDVELEWIATTEPAAVLQEPPPAVLSTEDVTGRVSALEPDASAKGAVAVLQSFASGGTVAESIDAAQAVEQ